jgi:hypothetical protein
MVVEPGEKVHIIERRYFVEDVRRHFIGQVVKAEPDAIRIKGYAWVFEPTKANYVRKPEVRERVFYPSDRLIINIIPLDVDLGKIRYETVAQKGLVVTDDKEFSLDINEFGSMR